jgi:hypothetical protein
MVVGVDSLRLSIVQNLYHGFYEAPSGIFDAYGKKLCRTRE